MGEIGVVPNNSILQGTIKTAEVVGITTSTWNARSGGSSKTVYKGTQDQITALAQTARDEGREYNIVSGHIWTLEILYPFDRLIDDTEDQSDPLFVWELTNQPFEKDILELTDRRFISRLSQPTKDAIETKLRTLNSSQLKEWDDSDSAYPNIKTDAKVAYNLKRSGVHGKSGIVQTLKRTMIVSNAYAGGTNLIFPENNYRVLTKATLLSTYNVNTNVLNNIPSVIVNAMPEKLTLETFSSPGPPVQTNIRDVSGFSMDKNGIVTFVGYLQFPPEYQMVGVQKVQITQNWVFNQWSAGPWGLYDSTFVPADGSTYPANAYGFGSVTDP